MSQSKQRRGIRVTVEVTCPHCKKALNVAFDKKKLKEMLREFKKFQAQYRARGAVHP